MFPRVVTKWNQSDQVTIKQKQQLLINTVNLHLQSFDKRKTLGPEKCLVTLKLPFINKSSEMLEYKLNHW